ncbi:hypothetical protein BDF22DRAFT_678375 [Syncephalis plumigaleata]|nr:hypothetical protein BDF22DRAFT_678375 [Syncephalis plumigaleata]
MNTPPLPVSRAEPNTQLPQNLSALLGGITPEHLRLMQEIQATLSMKQQQLAQQPNDPVLTNVINVLSQLLGMVPTLQLNPTVIAGIQQTLAMQRSSTPPIVGPSTTTTAATTNITAATMSNPANISSLIGKLSNGSTASMPKMSAPAPVSTIGAAPSTGNQLDPAMIASLISQLSSVPGLATAVTSSSGTTNIPLPTLTQEGIQRKCPGLFENIYSKLGLRCGQCGLRFSDDERGRSRMSAHLDRHFKQNRRLKELISRSWFVRDEDWIHSRLVTNEDENVFTKGVVRNEQPDQEATLRAQTVVSPSDVKKKLPCPICQEKFEEFWCDDEDQWMLRNAVMVNDRIYHATCYTDTAMIEDSTVTTTTSSNVSSSANSPTASGILGKRKYDNQHEDGTTSNNNNTSTSTSAAGMTAAEGATHALQNDAKKMAVTIQMVR